MLPALAPGTDAPWRLFLALWPPPAFQQALAAHAAQWTWSAAARRTAVERLHLTLHFLGEVQVARVPLLRQVLRVPWEGCTLALDAATVWPGGIAVLEAQVLPAPLARLHVELGQALRSLGLPVEQRRYRPHVTLARRAQGAQPPARFEPLRWETGPGYLLVRSLPGGHGYVPVQPGA